MAKIQIRVGRDGDGNAAEQHLIRNHLIDPNRNIDKVLQYADQRFLMTFLTAGVTDSRYTAPGYINGPGEKETANTKVLRIPESDLIDGYAYKYKIMGRIQKASEILGTGPVGTVVAATTNQGGTFKLRIRDNYITPGMMVIFSNGKHARCTMMPSGSSGNYLYTFKTKPGETFSWNTWIAVQSGTKTCFGGYTSYGERSLRGYGKVHYPDMYINHMTIQRKSISISGDANSNYVNWYSVNGSKVGWTYEAEDQIRAQFAIEDEHQKWWGESNMKDGNGNLLSSPVEFDEETGEPIIRGDGFVQQILGANDMETSGALGAATYDDFEDMATSLRKKVDQLSGHTFYVVTGADGMANADNVIGTRATQMGMNFEIDPPQNAGGTNKAIGWNFRKLNIGGHQFIFVEHPLFDDEQRFPLKLSNGKSKMSSTYYFVDASPLRGGGRNIEIRARGRAGVNRNWVYLMKNGMTGAGTPQEAIDAQEFHILKQNMVVVKRTKSCGILTPPTGA